MSLLEIYRQRALERQGLKVEAARKVQKPPPAALPFEVNGLWIYKNFKPCNNILILLQTHGAEDDLLKRNWPWLLNSGSDILVTFPKDDPADFYGTVIGEVIKNPPHDYWHLQERAMIVLRRVLMSLREKYSSVMLLHYDCVFLAPLKERVPEGLETYAYPYPQKRFKAQWKACLPWWFEWGALEKFLTAALRKPMNYQEGFFDCWVPAVCEDAGIKVTQTELISYECCELRDGETRSRAAKSIQEGRPFVHGVKTQEQLDWVLEVAGL